MLSNLLRFILVLIYIQNSVQYVLRSLRGFKIDLFWICWLLYLGICAFKKILFGYCSLKSSLVNGLSIRKGLLSLKAPSRCLINRFFWYHLLYWPSGIPSPLKVASCSLPPRRRAHFSASAFGIAFLIVLYCQYPFVFGCFWYPSESLTKSNLSLNVSFVPSLLLWSAKVPVLTTKHALDEVFCFGGLVALISSRCFPFLISVRLSDSTPQTLLWWPQITKSIEQVRDKFRRLLLRLPPWYLDMLCTGVFAIVPCQSPT